MWFPISAPFLGGGALPHPPGYFGVLVARARRVPAPRSPSPPRLQTRRSRPEFPQFQQFWVFFSKTHKTHPKKNLKPAAPPPAPSGLRAGGLLPPLRVAPPALRRRDLRGLGTLPLQNFGVWRSWGHPHPDFGVWGEARGEEGHTDMSLLHGSTPSSSLPLPSPRFCGFVTQVLGPWR